MMLPSLSAGGDLALTGGAGGPGGPAMAYGGTASGMFDNSGFTVNYAPGLGIGGGSLPSWLWMAAAVAGMIWLARH